MNPEPEPSPDRPSADSSPSSASSGGGPGSVRGEAYIPRPDEPRRRRLGPWLAAALLLAGAGGYAVHRHQSAVSPAAATAVQEKVLTLRAADADAAATARVRQSQETESPAPPPSGGAALPAAAPAAPVAHASSMGSGEALPAAVQTPAPAQAPAPGPAAAPKVQESPRPIPLPGLTYAGRQAVRVGGYEIFSMEMIDDVFEDGDAVLISVDGTPMCYVTISHATSRLEIPLKPGESHKITITGIEDGGDVVTLGVRTSLGDMISSPLMKGQSETWTIQFK